MHLVLNIQPTSTTSSKKLQVLIQSRYGIKRFEILNDCFYSFEFGGYLVDAQLGNGSMAELAGFTIGQKKTNLAGGILISTGKDEFIAIGKDYNISFTPLQQDGKTLDVDYFDEGAFVNDKWITTRRLNGDKGTGGGDYGFGFKKGSYTALRFQPSATGDYRIVRFKIHRYG